MDLSIIISHFNREASLRKCLASIPNSNSGLTYEMIVVDNHSTDGSVAMIREEFPEALLIQNSANEGFSRATNRGVKQAKGDFLLCLNNDTSLLPNSLGLLFQFMKQRPEAGVAGGKILNRDGTLQFSARSFPKLETAFFNRSSLLTRLFPKNPFSRRYLLTDWDHNSLREVDWVSGSFFLIRRAALEDIGLFDERFFLYCEDVDYCRRAKEKGWHIYYVPEAVIVHDTPYSDARVVTLFFHHQSMYRFYKKYRQRKIFLGDLLVLGGIALRFFAKTILLTGRKILGLKNVAAS